MTAALLAFVLAGDGCMPQAEYHAPRSWDEDNSQAASELGVPANGVALIADATGKYNLKAEGGPIVILVNGGKSSLKFTSCDGCLPMVREAQDSKGKWRPIEWLAVSECGNSYDVPSLRPGRAWTWGIPTNSGEFKTKVRFAVRTGGKIIRSNAFEDRINPAMFSLEDGLKGSKFLKVGV